MARSLHYSFGEKRAVSEPLDAQAPHVTFPLYRVMDWFVVTPPSETRALVNAHHATRWVGRVREGGAEGGVHPTNYVAWRGFFQRRRLIVDP